MVFTTTSLFDSDPLGNTSVLNTSVVLGIFFDGFEMGDTSLWSLTVP
jgi:hypothetical protein